MADAVDADEVDAAPDAPSVAAVAMPSSGAMDMRAMPSYVQHQPVAAVPIARAAHHPTTGVHHGQPIAVPYGAHGHAQPHGAVRYQAYGGATAATPVVHGHAQAIVQPVQRVAVAAAIPSSMTPVAATPIVAAPVPTQTLNLADLDMSMLDAVDAEIRAAEQQQQAQKLARQQQQQHQRLQAQAALQRRTTAQQQGQTSAQQRQAAMSAIPVQPGVAGRQHASPSQPSPPMAIPSHYPSPMAPTPPNAASSYVSPLPPPPSHYVSPAPPLPPSSVNAYVSPAAPPPPTSVPRSYPSPVGPPPRAYVSPAIPAPPTSVGAPSHLAHGMNMATLPSLPPPPPSVIAANAAAAAQAAAASATAAAAAAAAAHGVLHTSPPPQSPLHLSPHPHTPVSGGNNGNSLAVPPPVTREPSASAAFAGMGMSLESLPSVTPLTPVTPIPAHTPTLAPTPTPVPASIPSSSPIPVHALAARPVSSPSLPPPPTSVTATAATPVGGVMAANVLTAPLPSSRRASPLYPQSVTGVPLPLPVQAAAISPSPASYHHTATVAVAAPSASSLITQSSPSLMSTDSLHQPSHHHAVAAVHNNVPSPSPSPIINHISPAPPPPPSATAGAPGVSYTNHQQQLQQLKQQAHHLSQQHQPLHGITGAPQHVAAATTPVTLTPPTVVATSPPQSSPPVVTPVTSTPVAGAIVPAATTPATAATGATAAPPASGPVLKPVTVSFPATDAPFVVFQKWSLSGNECIAITQTMERLSSLGVTTADPGYAALASLFHTIARFVQQKTVKTKQQTATEQAWHAPIHGQAGSLFTQTQYHQLQVQLLALKALSSNVGQPIDPILKQTLVNYTLIKQGRAAEAVKHQELVTYLTSRQSDPCTALLDILTTRYQAAKLDANVLRAERDIIVTRQMREREQQLRHAIDGYHMRHENTPVEVLHEHQQLSLYQLQRRVRAKLIGSIPADAWASRALRSRDAISLDQRSRDKHAARQRAEHKRQQQENAERARDICNHANDFLNYHRTRHRDTKQLSTDVMKHHERVMKRVDEELKRQERERVMLLKERKEDEYLAMLKQAKNERLLTLWNQTEDYMAKLGATIAAEKQANIEQKIIEREESERIKRERTAAQNNNGDDATSPTNATITNGTHDSLTLDSLPELPIKTELSSSSSSSADTNTNGLPSDGLKMKRETSVKKEDGKDDSDGLVGGRKKYYTMAHTIEEKLIGQPSALKAGQLRSYQLEGVQWLLSLYNNQLNGILADEMGLGKTVQTLSLLAYLMEYKHNYGPFLIIVPMSTLNNNWKYEFDRWWPDCNKVVYDGTKDQRRIIREDQLESGDFNVLITTFELVMRDKKYLQKIKWEYIIVDEAHRLKNPKCKLAMDLALFSQTARRVALTGTPLQNELPELWALLNFLHPSIFNSVDNFEKWFATPFANIAIGAKDEKDKQVAMTEEEKLLVIDRLHSILRPFMLRREKKDVAKDLADKLEKVLRCELSQTQRLMYESILTGRVILHNKMMQLRKVCNHPYLFHPYYRNIAGSKSFDIDQDLVRICGKFALLDQILPKLKRTGHRVLIFSQMTKLMDVLALYFDSRGYRHLRLDGTSSADDRSRSVAEYNAADSPYFIFMLSTRAGGLGLNLQAADTVILFDSDWNPQNDLQAQARAHRIGQKKQVMVLRIITTGTVEEKVQTTAQNKLDAEAMVIQAGMFNDRYSTSESRAKLTKLITTVHASDTGDMGDDDEVSQVLARNEEELQIYRSMDAERLAKSGVLNEAKGNDRQLPHDMIPTWIDEWCKIGDRARSDDQTLIKVDRKAIFESEIKDASAPTYAPGRDGKMRRPRADKTYAESDHDDDSGGGSGSDANGNDGDDSDAPKKKRSRRSRDDDDSDDDGKDRKPSSRRSSAAAKAKSAAANRTSRGEAAAKKRRTAASSTATNDDDDCDDNEDGSSHDDEEEDDTASATGNGRRRSGRTLSATRKRKATSHTADDNDTNNDDHDDGGNGTGTTNGTSSDHDHDNETVDGIE